MNRVEDNTIQYAFCRLSAASVRQLPKHDSPQISQVLFGEFVQIIRRKNKQWSRIVCNWDRVVGWVDLRQFEIYEGEIEKYSDCQSFALELIHGAISSDQVIPVSIGSNFYACDGINFKMPFGKFQFTGQIVDLSQSRLSAQLLVKIAKKYLHAPFQFGGRSIMGIDPAGFIQVVYKMVGLNLPRSLAEQGGLGEDVGFVKKTEVGDLAFFQSKNKEIIHVGIVIEDQKIIHVDGMVRIDNIDQQGIFNQTKKRYTYKLRTIRRIENFNGFLKPPSRKDS